MSGAVLRRKALRLAAACCGVVAVSLYLAATAINKLVKDTDNRLVGYDDADDYNGVDWDDEEECTLTNCPECNWVAPVVQLFP